MNVDDVITEARDITKEESYDDHWMVKRINMGLKEIAAVLAIPGLSTSDTVTATSTQDHVAMPADYSHDLYLVTTERYPNGLTLHENLKSLIEDHDTTEKGNVRKVTIHFTDLYYSPLPVEGESETITLFYYGHPDEVTINDEFPSWIPSHLQKPLMLNYLTKEIFSLVEEGIDGQTPNTTKYSQLYGQAVMMLQAFYPNAAKPYYKPQHAPVWF